jgi:hypothetical protein
LSEYSLILYNKQGKMKPSKSAERLHTMIVKAIDDHILTRDEYDEILHLATEDGMIDRQEQALLEHLSSALF